MGRKEGARGGPSGEAIAGCVWMAKLSAPFRVARAPLIVRFSENYAPLGTHGIMEDFDQILML